MIENNLQETEPEVYEFLALLIKSNHYKHVMEIGFYKGIGTLRLLKHIPEEGFYCGVDCTSEYLYDEVRNKILSSKVVDKTLCLGDSIEVLKNAKKNFYDLILIDTQLPADYLRKQFKECERVLRAGGMVVINKSYQDIPTIEFIEELRFCDWYEVLNISKTSGEGMTIVKNV